ncbi:hypothetical protein GGX14DRAFT_388905 [Mycena pura]|uniref:Uncharacterized protein n=1 Tax=Mycena pura TaxID=153505 RepID=A0AAD6VWU4_9AGAR|nr:hypothetical protein GGX14DRAFT_388905 [Mycena pura]
MADWTCSINNCVNPVDGSGLLTDFSLYSGKIPYAWIVAQKVMGKMTPNLSLRSTERTEILKGDVSLAHCAAVHENHIETPSGTRKLLDGNNLRSLRGKGIRCVSDVGKWTTTNDGSRMFHQHDQQFHGKWSVAARASWDKAILLLSQIPLNWLYSGTDDLLRERGERRLRAEEGLRRLANIIRLKSSQTYTNFLTAMIIEWAPAPACTRCALHTHIPAAHALHGETRAGMQRHLPAPWPPHAALILQPDNVGKAAAARGLRREPRARGVAQARTHTETRRTACGGRSAHQRGGQRGCTRPGHTRAADGARACMQWTGCSTRVRPTECPQAHARGGQGACVPRTRAEDGPTSTADGVRAREDQARGQCTHACGQRAHAYGRQGAHVRGRRSPHERTADGVPTSARAWWTACPRAQWTVSKARAHGQHAHACDGQGAHARGRRNAHKHTHAEARAHPCGTTPTHAEAAGGQRAADEVPTSSVNSAHARGGQGVRRGQRAHAHCGRGERGTHERSGRRVGRTHAAGATNRVPTSAADGA